MGAITPTLSNLYFIQSRETEARIEIRLSKGARCILVKDNPTFVDWFKMQWIAFQVKITDLAWGNIEKDYIDCFDLWKKGDEVLEEFIADNPDEYWNISTQEALKNREAIQKKLIVLGKTIVDFPFIDNETVKNPFVDGEKIKAVISFLIDDLENNPVGYFKELIDVEENDERQKPLELDQGRVQ